MQNKSKDDPSGSFKSGCFLFNFINLHLEMFFNIQWANFFLFKSQKKESTIHSLGISLFIYLIKFKKLQESSEARCACVFIYYWFSSAEINMLVLQIFSGRWSLSKLLLNNVMKGIKESLHSQSLYRIKYIIHNQYLYHSHQPFCLEIILGPVLLLWKEDPC